jgi:hypothetical protein
MSYLDLNAALDELAQAAELRAFCDAFLAAQKDPALEDLAVAISGDLSNPKN